MPSVAGFVATPTYSVYAASKFAVRGFSEALRREVGIYNVKVSLICPGAVATEFGEIAGFHRTTEVTMPAFLTLSAEKVARAVLRLERRPRRVLVIPWLLNFAVWSNALMPDVLDWVMERFFVVPERAP
jgi:short-subunit dehydrogenase